MTCLMFSDEWLFGMAVSVSIPIISVGASMPIIIFIFVLILGVPGSVPLIPIVLVF